jgi:hypothetical protein
MPMLATVGAFILSSPYFGLECFLLAFVKNCLDIRPATHIIDPLFCDELFRDSVFFKGGLVYLDTHHVKWSVFFSPRSTITIEVTREPNVDIVVGFTDVVPIAFEVKDVDGGSFRHYGLFGTARTKLDDQRNF